MAKCMASFIVVALIQFAFIIYLMHNNSKCVKIIYDRDKTIKSQEKTIIKVTADLIKTANELEYQTTWKQELAQKYPGVKL